MIYYILIYFGLLILYGLGMWTLCILPEVTTSEKPYTGFKNIGHPINPIFRINGATYRKFVISEDCIPFRVKKNQIIDIRRDGGIKEGDLVVIYQNDTNFKGYKLREVSKVTKEEVSTFWNGKDGERIYDNYVMKNVIGKYEKKN